MEIPYSLDLARLAAAYARGDLTPARVARDVCTVIEANRANPIWIERVPRDALQSAARGLEVRRAAGEALPLYGVPFAVKDNIDVAGMHTTAACPVFSRVAEETAPAVRELLDAGALLIGKTNLDQFATGLVGTRSPYGTCVNPFNPAYIAGGSSSGSAPAVALGMVSFALGTDTAGSGRVPAAFNNVVGLKPTRGVVSTRGVVPACRSLDCVSVFALTCEDATAVLEVMRGFDAEDGFSRVSPAGPRAPASLSRFRCGVPDAAHLEFFGDAAARQAFEAHRATLTSIGADLVEINFAPFLEAARLLYEGPWVAERYAGLKPFLAGHMQDLHPVTREIIGAAGKWSAVDAFEALYRLRELRRRAAAEWEKMDVLAVPSTGTIYTLREVEAAPIASNTNLGYYTNFVNLFDLAAVAVPGAFRNDGLPAGITLIGAAHTDGLLAAIGARFHRASRVRLGATTAEQPELSPIVPPAAEDAVVVAVVGAHLSGLPLNQELTARGARVLETTRTARAYRLYELPSSGVARPGLVRVAEGAGAAIEVELWAMARDAFGGFVAGVAAPLSIGTLALEDGRAVKGFLCEGYAIAGARDITQHGGWRNFLASRT